MRLNHNIYSLNAFRSYTKILQDQSSALNKITSGYKVVNAKDDPNVIAQSQITRIQIAGVQMAARNVQDGVSLLQTAEGGLENINNILIRVRELIVGGQSDTYSRADKDAMKEEIKQLTESIKDIVNNTEFNDLKLFTQGKTINDPVTTPMQAGANVGEVVNIPFYNLKVSSQGIDIENLDVEDVASFKKIDEAIKNVVSIRNKYGALTNRFEETMDSLGEISYKMEGVDSNLRDSDIAEEMMNYARANVLHQSCLSIMYQTNNFPMDMLRILENVGSK